MMAVHRDAELIERLRFLNLDEATRRELKSLWRVIEPALPGILERFYIHLRTVPALAALIGPLQPQLVAGQSMHWSRLFSGRFDDDYVQGIRRVGLAHHKIGLEPRWYLGGYAFVMNELVMLLATKHRFRPTALARAVAALNKAILLDMDYAISVYQDVLLQERQKHGEHLSQAIVTFSEAVQGSLQVSEEANGALAQSAEILDTTTGQADTLARGVAAAAEQTSENMRQGATAAEELAAFVHQIGGQATHSADVARNAALRAAQTNKSVAGLAEQAREIGQVVGLINQIAQQTNLLALNATIEAARAGGAGRGFAVVAQEVKLLSNQVASATTEISAKIKAIQEATDKSAAEIEDIAVVIGEVNSTATSIAMAVEEQMSVTARIASNVMKTAAHTDQVAKNIDTLCNSVTSASRAAQQVSRTRSMLEQQFVRLKCDIDAFLKKARAI